MLEGGAGLLVQLSVGDDDVDLVETARVGERTGAQLGTVHQEHGFAGVREHVLRGEGFGGVGGGQSSIERQADRAHEGMVEIELVEDPRAQGAHECLGERPELTADDDEARAGTGQLDDGRQAVGDDRDVGAVGQQLGQLQAGGAGIEVDLGVGLHHLGGALGDALLLGGVGGGLGFEAGLDGAGVEGDGATVHAPQLAFLLQLVEVTADGGGRDAEFGLEVLDAHGVARLDDLLDTLTPLGRERDDTGGSLRIAHE